MAQESEPAPEKGGGGLAEFTVQGLGEVDMENISMEECFAQLRSSKKGLTSEGVEERVKIFGQNRLEEKKENAILKFLGYMNNPLSWVMEAAAVVALVVSNGQGEPPDWQDFLGIVFLLLVNATLSYIEEENAGKAAAALMGNLALVAKVVRDGEWIEINSAELVPGDVVSIRGGDIVPADCRLLEGEPLKIDQSALTGESLPVSKAPGESVYSGSTCKQGELQAVVTATGVNSFLGKAAALVDSTDKSGHFQMVLTAIGAFCIVLIFVCILIEIIVMFPIQKRRYRDGIDNILVLLIGGIPIAMPTVLSVTMAIGSHHLASEGAIVKRITAIEEMAGMDILCSDKTGTLTLNQLSVDTNIIEVFVEGLSQLDVLILAVRAARSEHPDAIDKAMLDTLAENGSSIEKAREGITELHHLPFNPVDKRAATTYVLPDGSVERASKGAPEQILSLAHNKEAIEERVHNHIIAYADRGLRSLAVARQAVPEGREAGAKGEGGGPWEFVGLLPLLDPPRHDTAETIESAIKLGVNVKMITGDQLAIGKETARRLGMGSNMYPASMLTHPEMLPAGTNLEELVETADGFAGVFPEHKYNIVKLLQGKGHLTGMTGDGVNDAPALKAANVGIAVADATDAARAASDIVLTEPGLSVIITAILRSRIIFQRMKNYVLYDTAGTVRIVVGFMLLALIWKFDTPPFLVLIIAFLNNGTIMAISKDRVRPSQYPDHWGLTEIFATCITMGFYQAAFSCLFYWAVRSNYLADLFNAERLHDTDDPEDDRRKQAAVVYLQVSVSNQAMIFVTRAQYISYFERPGLFLIAAFAIAQTSATFIAVYANWGFVPVTGCGWGWAGIVWIYCLVFYVPLDFVKLATEWTFRYYFPPPVANIALIQAQHAAQAAGTVKEEEMLEKSVKAEQEKSEHHNSRKHDWVEEKIEEIQAADEAIEWGSKKGGNKHEEPSKH